MLEGPGTLAFVGLGSNVGRRILHLAAAVHALMDFAVNKSAAVSPVYETDPVGYLDQDPFLNMVLALRVSCSAHEFLAKLLQVEADEGRVRTIQNGPRTLDLDLLLFDQMTLADDVLQLPHPRLHTRAFVLCPLADLAPDIVLQHGRTVAECAKDSSREGGIRYVGRFW
jgi:2-amino-4-hydroxy-6-hydroxymethyldihydropteridine diphosphokinase